jgi:preprotein translocase subunit SecA
MNSQREVIYKRRHNALFGDKLSSDIANMVFDTAEQISGEFLEGKDFEAFKFSLFRVFAMEMEISRDDALQLSSQDLTDRIFNEAMAHYQRRMDRIAMEAFPVVKNVYETQKGQYENILVPFTDGAKALQVASALEKAYESSGKSVVRDFEKGITLTLIDEEWKNHLRRLDDLKQYVQGAVHEQKDPLLIYKFESFELFKNMMAHLSQEVLSFLFKGSIPMNGQQNVRQAPATPKKQEQLSTSGPGSAESSPGRRPSRPKTVVKEKKLGRNDLVVIRNVATGEQKKLKFKVAEPLIAGSQWVLEQD